MHSPTLQRYRYTFIRGGAQRRDLSLLKVNGWGFFSALGIKKKNTVNPCLGPGAPIRHYQLPTATFRGPTPLGGEPNPPLPPKLKRVTKLFKKKKSGPRLLLNICLSGD